MADIQKQNISITPDSLQIETSGNAIIAISGHPLIGTGGDGKLYKGDDVYVTVNNDVNPGIITLTQTSIEKLNREIPSAVSSFPDSIQYAQKTEIPDSIAAFDDTDTVIYSYLYPLTADIQQQLNGKQNKLQFDLNAKGEISAIGTNQTTAIAGANGITGDYYSASNPSGFINSTQAETQILEKHYLTEASGNARYIPIPEGLSDNQYYAYTTSSWKVIQGAGDVSGISTVAHDDTLTGNGNNENLGVDTTKIQTKLTDAQIQNITDVTTLKTASSTWDNVSAKLNTSDFNTYTATTAPSTYQQIGNYLSSNALEGYATQDWVDDQGYIKQETDWTNTIQEASAKAYNDATANANSLYQAKGDYVKNTDIGLNSNNKVTAISGKELIITAHQSLTNYYTKSETSGATQLSTEFGKYLTKTIADGYYYPLSTNPSNYATSAGLTQSKQYAMTTTGWSEITGGGSTFTGVTTGVGLSGNGLSNSPLGIDTNASIYLSNGSAKSAVSAGSATSALSADKAESAESAKWLREGNAHVSAGDVTALQNWASSNSSTWNDVTAKLGTAQYALDSATFVTSSNLIITGTKQYALTTTGWSDIGLSAYLPLSGGTVSGDVIVKSTGKNLLAVNTTATLMGQSRVANLTDTTAIGTNWLGVNSFGGGFLKNVQGGNVGDLNGTSSIQINFASDGANSYGNITVNSQDNMSKVVHIPTASYNSMSSFDNTYGPNYMLRKTASGFDIGAAVINVTTLPAQTEANTYYFIYDT